VISRAVSALILVYFLGYALFAVLLPRPAAEGRTDAIVVLTGGPNRLERGIDLLERGQAKRLLISGVARTVRPEELAAQHQAEAALFECCIDLGRQAVDTRSNAEEVSRWMARHKFRSLRLVTTDWHMPRARFELSRRLGDGIEVTGDAVESNPRFYQLFVEYNKYLLRRGAVFLGV
jgi:uncharacterized SAM-binding protein YcdF (DUF218 family)